MRSAWPITVLAALAAWPQPLLAAPRASLDAQRLTVEARGYRLTVHRYRCDLTLELRDARGGWHAVCRKGTQPEFALSDATGVDATLGSPSRLVHRVDGDAVVVRAPRALHDDWRRAVDHRRWAARLRASAHRTPRTTSRPCLAGA